VWALLADLPRKNCWRVAEHAGDADPYGMQHFLAHAGHPWGSYPDDFDGITGMSPTQAEGERPTLDEWRRPPFDAASVLPGRRSK
jgi:hypothetical protein